MREFIRKHQKKLATFIVVLVPILIMVLSGRPRESIETRQRDAFGGVVMGWLQSETMDLTSGLERIWTSWGQDEAAHTIERLEVENARLREEKTRLIGVLQENARLRELLEFKQSRPGLNLIPARIISRDITPYFRILRVRLEAAEEVTPRMPVVAHGGIVGQVYAVNGRYADVMLVSDPRSRIDAVSQRNRAHGMVEGLGRARSYFARVSYLQKHDEVRPGDVMVTSGMGEVFPAELVIGVVEQVAIDEYSLFQEALLRPAVDVSRVEEVFVVQESASSVADGP